MKKQILTVTISMIATLSLVGFTSSYLKPKVVSATVLEAKPIEPITIEIEPISIEINETEMFLDAIGHRESSNRYTVVNKWGYMGKYQFGKRTLKSLGYDVSRNKSPVAGLDGVELATVIFAFAPNPVARPATFACAIAPSAIPILLNNSNPVAVSA